MSRNRSDFELARDQLFSHITACGVLKAPEDQQQEWLDETAAYLAQQFPALSREELDRLKATGRRFCRPAIPHGKRFSALNAEGWQNPRA